jgi:hypothetical protein
MKPGAIPLTRFTIRDILCATAIVGLSLGWMMDRWRWQAELSEFVTNSSKRRDESPQESTIGELLDAIDKSQTK